MDPVIQKAYQAAQKRQNFAFATITRTTAYGTPRKAGAKMIVLADGSIAGTVGGGRDERLMIEECRKAIRSKKSKLVTYHLTGKAGEPLCGGEIQAFIEPFSADQQLIICGAGHIALPLSFIGKLLNFHVTILDDRKEFANNKRFPHADKILCGNFIKNLRKTSISSNCFVVIITHGHEYDFDCLKELVSSPARYIGVIASHIKAKKFIKNLKIMRFSKSQLARIKMPVGIDIGAQTPEEIAVSIAAEIIKENNKDLLNTLKFKAKQKDHI